MTPAGRAGQRTSSWAAPQSISGWIGLLIVAVILAVLPLPSWTVERAYSRNIYPTLQSGLTSFSNIVPLALLDLMIVGAVILCVRRIMRLLRAARIGGFVPALGEGLARLIRAASVVTILFFLFWGLNYRRIPLEEALKMPVLHPGAADLQSIISDANVLASRTRAQPAGQVRESYEDIARDLIGPFNLALKKLDRPALVSPGRPKYSLILTPFFTWSGVTGMVDPLALESIVHPDLLPFERPFVLAHEWAHLAGQADEAEASAVGWLACMQGDRAFAYSASLYVIEEAGAALPTNRWLDSYRKLDPGVQADLQAIRKRMEGERPIVQHAASEVYDKYLKANHVDDGVRSYSRALALIMAPPFRDALSNYSGG